MKKTTSSSSGSATTSPPKPLLNYPTSNFNFEGGLYGFEHLKHFNFSRYHTTPFYLLVAAEKATLKFTLLAPHPFFPDYHLALADTLTRAEKKHSKIFLIVTFGKTLKDTTVNLLGPVLLNFESKKGRQVIAQQSIFTTKHSLWQPGSPSLST